MNLTPAQERELERGLQTGDPKDFLILDDRVSAALVRKGIIEPTAGYAHFRLTREGRKLWRIREECIESLKPDACTANSTSAGEKK